MTERNTGRTAGWRVWALAALLAAGPAFAGPAQGAEGKAKRPSFSFMRGCRKAFDRALAGGDTAGARAALDELGTRGVDDPLREGQLAQAREVEALFAAGAAQLEAEDFAGADATWAGLERAREKIREDWTIVWEGSGYPEWLDREMAGFRGRRDGARDAFAERTKRRFDESVSAKNWGDAEGCIAELAGNGIPTGGMEGRLETAKAVEAAGEAYLERFGKGDWAAAGEELSKLEALGADTSARRREWRGAYAAECGERFDAALAGRDYAGAEALLGTFGELGEDTAALEGRIREKRAADAREDFEAALADGRADDAEGRLAVLAELGEDVGEGRERVRGLRLSQRREEFDAALARRDFGAAEALEGAFAELGEGFGDYAERIRQGRVAEIREGLAASWEAKDVRAVREACGRLAGLGDGTAEEESRLAAAFGEELAETAAAMKAAADGVRKPDFDAAEGLAAAFRARWAGVLDGDAGALDETLRVARKKFALREQSTEGPLSGGCPEYWLRCMPELLLEEDPEARIDGLRVHLAGVATGVAQGAAGSRYRISGLYGGELEVETGPSAPLPRQWIYLMATVRTKDGGVSLEEVRRAPLGAPRKPLGGEYARWLDEGGYDYLLENCFREFGHAPEGKRLAPLGRYAWEGGKRTTAEEFAGR